MDESRMKEEIEATDGQAGKASEDPALAMDVAAWRRHGTREGMQAQGI